MEKVYILWHVHEIDQDNEDAKLIGVYSTKKGAELAKKRTAKLPGFRKTKRKFHISEYRLDKDHWQEGFITVK